MDENNVNPIDNGAENVSEPVSNVEAKVEEPVYTAEQYNPQPQESQPAGSNGLAIASLVCGILGLLSSCSGCFALPLSIAAIIMGGLGKKKAVGSGKGMAVAGLICGIIGTLIALVLTVLSIIAVVNESM